MNTIIGSLRSVRFGLCLAFLAILFGIGMGLAFGAAEAKLKSSLKQDAMGALQSAYKGDKAKATATWKKSWSYYKRAHLHAGGMGTTALAVCVLLGFLALSDRSKMVLSAMIGTGSLGYSLFWLWAGARAPALGSTHLAKESLNWLAIPTAGMYAVGIAVTFVLLIRGLFIQKSKSESDDAAAALS